MSTEDKDYQMVLAAIKEAHKHPLYPSSREVVIEHVSNIPYMGFPTPLPAKARGRKAIRTQYDAALDRRKNLYRKLVTLPQSRIKAANARRKMGDPLRESVLQLADELSPTTPRYKLANSILMRLQFSADFNQTDKKTVRTILNKYFWFNR